MLVHRGCVFKDLLVESAGKGPFGTVPTACVDGQLAHTARAHLALYGRVHVALDSIPYNGTTTTCEALWMGVPVVALLGDRHASRVSASLLTAAGHPEWIASDAEGFVRTAASLAGDLPTLASIRASLRGQLRASTLLDSQAYSRRFHSAIRDCWRSWCTSCASAGA